MDLQIRLEGIVGESVLFPLVLEEGFLRRGELIALFSLPLADSLDLRVAVVFVEALVGLVHHDSVCPAAQEPAVLQELVGLLGRQQRSFHYVGWGFGLAHRHALLSQKFVLLHILFAHWRFNILEQCPPAARGGGHRFLWLV